METGECLEMNKPLVTDLGYEEVKRIEVGQILELFQMIVGNLSVLKDQIVECS